MKQLLKRVWRWLIKYQPLPCPRCSDDLHEQKNAFQGDGGRGRERHYICTQCERYAVFRENLNEDIPRFTLLYDRDYGFYKCRKGDS